MANRAQWFLASHEVVSIERKLIDQQSLLACHPPTSATSRSSNLGDVVHAPQKATGTTNKLGIEPERFVPGFAQQDKGLGASLDPAMDYNAKSGSILQSTLPL